ncbi:hypothetical protein [Neobacillus sp. PS3-40]|uniref:hypothetical protein n=1 Tax=Neobacillus sp. PS3-40 TaxID=3070679 RepID=UPI0027E1B88D|nr:hypothetical protein [Neobacillus sp. PS3-40]WML44640.1 hypothetical protein RCG20_01630 [Neobacillus sp. PS3-40]
MTKENLINFSIVGFLCGLGGLVMIFFSVNFGTSLAESWLVSQGGADTRYYHIIVKSNINNFLVAGGIIFGFGLLIIALTLYKFLNIS